MIDKYYACYQQLDDMLDVLNQTDRSKQSKLKLVNKTSASVVEDLENSIHGIQI